MFRTLITGLFLLCIGGCPFTCCHSVSEKPSPPPAEQPAPAPKVGN